MELNNDFRVSFPIDETWKVLTDLERVAPCMPGAQLTEVEGDEYRGLVKVKVGPITTQYQGVAQFIELDETNHKAVLRAEGRESRGQGNASATVTATLTADGDGTKVEIVTDMAITGKVAQFGRGVMADVTGMLLGQFAQNLEKSVGSGESKPSAPAPAPEAAPASEAAAPAPAETAAPAAEAPAPPTPTVRKIDGPPAKPVSAFSIMRRQAARVLLRKK